MGYAEEAMNEIHGTNVFTESQRTSQVIEHKLLDSLSDEGAVAILASKEDLDALIYALTKIATGKYVAETDWHDFHNAEELARQLRAKEFAAGLEQLRREAFGE